MSELGVPAIDDQAAIRKIADSRLPLIARRQMPPFDDAAAWKAQKARLHVAEQLNQIGPQTVRTVLPGLFRIKRDQINVNLSRSIQQQVQARLAARRRRANDSGIGFPPRDPT